MTTTPSKFLLPFANAGERNVVPAADSPTAGLASYETGFPPETLQPISTGGVPPAGKDFNGLLYDLSAVLRHLQSGASFAYDESYASSGYVGGYPLGARIMRTDGQGFWINNVDGNATDPENAASAAGWEPDYTTGVATVVIAAASVTPSRLIAGRPVLILTGTRTAISTLTLPPYSGKSWAILNNSTGTVVVQTSVGGASVSINPARTAHVVANGTDLLSVSGSGSITDEDVLGSAVTVAASWGGSTFTKVHDALQELFNRSEFLRAQAGKVEPVGSVGAFARVTAPEGWVALTPAAQLLSVGAYPELFAALSTKYGGDGVTTFGIPGIAEGRALLAGLASNPTTIGASTSGEIKSHAHAQTVFAAGGNAGHIPVGFASAGAASYDYTTLATGGDNNLAAGVKFLICIKAANLLSSAGSGNIADDYRHLEAVSALGSVGSSLVMNLNDASVFSVAALTTDTTVSVTNLPTLLSAGLALPFGIRFVSGSAGHAITWPASWVWSTPDAVPDSDDTLVRGWLYADGSANVWIEGATMTQYATKADLANTTDPAKGAGMVGDVKFGTVKAALDRVESALRGDTGKSYRVVSAILRNTGSGWFVLDDGGHNPIGVNSVSVNTDGSLHVDYDNLGQANIVNTLLAVPDETFASMGLVLGSSVSNEFCNIYLYAPLDFRINMDTGAVSAPDYFFPEISRVVEESSFTINHPHIVYADNITLSANPVGGAASLGSQAKTSPISNTSTSLEINTNLHTYIVYDGSAFTCTLGNSGSQITAVWNGALLSVVRPDVGVVGLSSIKLTPRYPYNIYFDGISGVNADIKFTTKEGLDVTTPDTNMKFMYSETFPNVHSGGVKVTTGVYQFSASLARINANNLTSAGGNIWLFGIMEEVV